MYGSNFSTSSSQHYVWLANSDWRTETTWRVESGPDMGAGADDDSFFEGFEGSEPNDSGSTPGEDYADMEINRLNRVQGQWNDLPLRPSPSGALDAISGYIVEYGGWDYTDVDLSGDETIDEDTKICYARATIRKAEYVKLSLIHI